MQTALVNGEQLAYVESGTGPSTFFVHGIPTDYRAWGAQMGPFSSKYHVIAYSRRLAQPNKNQGSFPESIIEDNAKDLEELIQKIGTPPVNLIGHSYGGFIAAYLAANKSELIRKLVLIEPGITTLLIQNPESKAQMFSFLLRSPRVALAAGRYIRRYYNPLLEAYHKGDLDGSLGYFLDGFMNKTGALGQLPENIQTMLKQNAATIGEVEAKLPPFKKNDARRISVPTLLINGSNGSEIFAAINRQLAKSIRNVEHTIIPDASHFPHFENPEKFNQVVLQFLERN
ncbi:alpha/beta hydrolase [Candidatus Bathyarchaeota archaeon]|nr:alpha/beta hydrolase [Candidatus Bathyarchaeota archaeon]